MYFISTSMISPIGVVCHVQVVSSDRFRFEVSLIFSPGSFMLKFVNWTEQSLPVLPYNTFAIVLML